MEGNKDIKVVNKRKWQEYTLDIGFTQEKILLAFRSILTLVVALGCFIIFAELFASRLEILTLLNLALVGLTIIFLALQFFLYLEKTTVEYKVIPGKVHIVNDNYQESVQGKILIRTGVILRKERFLGMDEFNRASVAQSFLQKLTNTGTLKLEEVNKLIEINTVRLPYVKEPFKNAQLIQSMIDIENG